MVQPLHLCLRGNSVVFIMRSAALAKRGALVCSTGPGLGPIQLIHRHTDGVITFHTKRKTFKNLIGIRAAALERSFPKLAAKLRQDAYFSLNAYWYGATDLDEVPARRARKRDCLRFLCTAFCDLDCYKAGIKPLDAATRIADLERLEIIPAVSGFAFSGRGLWVFWLLEDRDGSGRAQRAFREKIDLYDRIQKALSEKLEFLGADARDACRIARVPGSRNSKSGLSVRFKFYSRPDGSPITYKLDDLKHHLGMEDKQRSWRARSENEGPSNPNRRRGWEALASRRLREFERLRQVRNGFEEGCRNNAAMLYAWLLRCTGDSRSMAETKVFQLGRECRPRLPPSECRAALKTGFNPKMRRFRDQRIADLLVITLGESQFLEKLPPASIFHSQQPPLPTPKNMRVSAQQRRDLILQLVDKLGCRPSTREMARVLAEHGCHVSHVSVAEDYKQLGTAATAEPTGLRRRAVGRTTISDLSILSNLSNH
jgi:hypothetical protein